MFLTPAAARPWLAPDSRNRPWPGYGAMLVRRREAIDQLYAAYGSWARLGVGLVAWGLGTGGAVLVGRGVSAGGEGSTTSAGIGLLVLATFLGGAVVATGSSLARAAAGWWTLATAVRADGGRVDATTVDPDTRRAHEETVTRDRSTGRAELWRMPLLPRTVVALLLTGAAAVLLVQAALGFEEVSRPYAGDDLRGEWLIGVIVAVVCLLTGLLTVSGLRRVHRARMHRVGHDEPAAPAVDPASLTPAVGSGAIVIGGTLTPGAATPPPPWATSPSDASLDQAGVAPHPSAGAPASAPSDPPHAPTLMGPPPLPAPGSTPSDHAAAPTPAAAPSDAAAAPTTPRLRLSDGRELHAGVTLVGRAPRPHPDERADAVLAVADERVSKTHLTVRAEAGRVVVVDRGSTNGTVVHDGDGPHILRPGDPWELSDGDVVVLGGTTLTVGEPGEDVEHTVLRERPE